MAIRLDHVTKRFGKQLVLNGFTLQFPDSGTVCLFGPSGCGKTTVMRLLCGLESPDSGCVQVQPDTAFSCVFQEDRLLPWLTAEENVAAVLPDPQKKSVGKVLAAVGLAEFPGKYPAQLSGGMRRRVAIARALAYGGDVLILDEPFNGIDDETKARIAEYILKQYRDKLVVLVTHSMDEAKLLNAQIVEMPSQIQAG